MSQSCAREYRWERGIAVKSSAPFLKAHRRNRLKMCASLCSLVSIWMPGRASCRKSIHHGQRMPRKQTLYSREVNRLFSYTLLPERQNSLPPLWKKERSQVSVQQILRMPHQNTECCTGCYLLREMPHWNQQALHFLPCKRTVKNESCRSVLSLFSPDTTHGFFHSPDVF